jgi:hypothetical protein
MPKLRLHWPASEVPAWILSEAEFINEFEALSPRDWANLPRGPVVAQGLDDRERVAWTGHYTTSLELGRLLRQLIEEREILARAARAARHGRTR